MATAPINDATTRNDYISGASQTTFPYTFWIEDSDDLDVYVNGVAVSNYTVSAVQSVTGANVVFSTPLASGNKVAIVYNPDIERLTEFQTSGQFKPSTLNLELTRLISLAQFLKTELARKVGVGSESLFTGDLDLPELSNNSNKFIRVNAAGNGLDAVALADGSIVANYATQLFNGDNSTVAFTLTNFTPISAASLMVTVGGDMQRPSIDYTLSGSVITFTSAPTTGTSNILVRNLATGATENEDGVINVLSYDSTGGTDLAAALTIAHAAAKDGDTLFLPNRMSEYEIGSMVTFSGKRITIDFRCKIKAATGFTGDFMFDIKDGALNNFFRDEVRITNLMLNGNNTARGLRLLKRDFVYAEYIYTERCYGKSITIDRVRESEFCYTVQNLNKHREAFSTPSDWDSATAYTVGDYVKLPAPQGVYNSGTTYAAEAIVEASDGRHYISLQASNTNNTPESSPTYWHFIPYECYQALLSGTNQNPKTMNANNAVGGNRYWIKSFQDEAVLEINDAVQESIDRSNELHWNYSIIRDSSNKAYVRIDCQRGTAYTTGIIFDDVHWHTMDPEVSGGAEANLVEQDETRIFEVGRVQNVQISTGLLRSPDSDDAIIALIGAQDDFKTPSKIHFTKNIRFSGESNNQIGLLVMPNAVRGDSGYDIKFDLGGTGAVEIFDHGDVFRAATSGTTERVIRAGLTGVTPVGELVEFDTSYAIARPREASYTGDGHARIREQLTSTKSGTLYGTGAATPTAFFGYDITNTRAEISGAPVDFDGTHTNHVLIRSRRIWSDSNGELRIKGSTPSSDTDGQTIYQNERLWDGRTAAPTTGNWVRGDIAWNLNPSAAGNIGWVCVTSGAPGTWKTFGTIET